MIEVSPSPAPPAVTCAVALSHATAGRSRLYHSLLPSALQTAVDQLIRVNAWRWTGALQAIAVPVASKYSTSIDDRVTLRNGDDIVLKDDGDARHLFAQAHAHRTYTHTDSHILQYTHARTYTAQATFVVRPHLADGANGQVCRIEAKVTAIEGAVLLSLTDGCVGVCACVFALVS